MSLSRLLHGALLSRQGPGLIDGDGLTFDGPQLLSLVQATADLLVRVASPPSSAEPVCAIFLGTSAAYVVTVLAALQLGLAFMPLDPSWPAHRLQQVCTAARPTALVWSAVEACCGGCGSPEVTGVTLLELPPLAGLLQHTQPRGRHLEPGTSLAQQQALGHAKGDGLEHEQACCYILFTSGSTGRPLGVRGTEAGIINRCLWMQEACPFQDGDRVAFKTSPCFVDSVSQVFAPLLAGATLIVVPHSVMRDAQQLLRALGEQHITHCVAVPTLWQALAATMRCEPRAAALLKLRVAVSSGERLPASLLAELQQLLPSKCRIWNLYGSTEVAADCTAFDCTGWQQPLGSPQQQQQQQEQAVPVGSPISGTLIAILDQQADPAASNTEQPAGSDATSHATAGKLQVVPSGSVGQVAVAGAGLAAGYLGSNEAATQQRFVQLPTSQLEQAEQTGASVVVGDGFAASFRREGQGSTRLLLTGDLGWLDAAGCLHLAGRTDLQVKIAGVRVDLSETEQVLNQHPAVSAAAAKVWRLPAGPLLVAYAELGPSTEAWPDGGSSQLRRWCSERLPPPAVPHQVLLLPHLPRSAAGKVQRSELPPLPEAAAQPGHDARTEAGEAQPAKRRRKVAGSPDTVAGSRLLAAPGPHGEAAVSRAFAAALGHTDFEATTNLFALGGDSLMAARIAEAVASGNLEAVYLHPTVRSLAAFIASASQPPSAAAGAAAGASGGGRLVPAAQQLPMQQQQQRGQQLYVLPVRPLDASGKGLDRGMVSSRSEVAEGILRFGWRSKMAQCVDAAPILQRDPSPVVDLADPLRQQQQQQQEQQRQLRVFACSHGGDVCCFSGSSGQQLWRTQLPDECDAGMVCCRSAVPGDTQQDTHIAVSTNGGTLHFLCASSGVVAGSVDAGGGGGIRAPPACDPWLGLIWQPTHGRQLVVASPPGQVAATLALPAAASAAVSFDAKRGLAFVCCLDGSLLAVAGGAGSTAADDGCLHLQLQVAWKWAGGVPLFVPTVVLDGSVVAAAVDGSVTALSCCDGSCLWRAALHDAIFTAPLLLPATALRPQTMLVGTQGGQLRLLEASSGQQLATINLGGKITGMQHLPAQTPGPQMQQRVVVCTASGAVALLDVAAPSSCNKLSGGTVRGGVSAYLDAVQLPGDVFAAPAAHGSGVIAVGCRDDHLYVLLT